MERFLLLSQPVQIGSLKLKHRMVMGPMWTRFASLNGQVTQQMIDYYAARARGGTAMMALESTTVDKRYGYTEATLRPDGAEMQPG